MKIPPTKKILREDLKDAPKWVSGIIEPVNNFMESAYQIFNKNITDADNIACQIKELSYKTTSAYPAADIMEFQSTLKGRATGVQLLQALDKATQTPAAGPVYVPWYDDNGVIKIYAITGLAASKTYLIRLRIT